ncbi:MAG: AmmeMemoRadiSam system protein B [Candidatus Aenigmatarchaeota archaeon]
MAEQIRPPAVSGMFYPAGEAELRLAVERLLDDADVSPSLLKKSDSLRAIVVPHAGYDYSGPIAAKGYALLKSAAEKRKVSKVVLLGPPHAYPLEGAAVSGADYWQTPIGRVKVSNLASSALEKSDIAHRHEHCLEVQLPFLQVALKDFEVAPILVGEADYEQLARALLPSIDEKTVVIASSDLSHYYPYDEAVRLDSAANRAIPSGDIEAAEQVEACGKSAILTLMHLARMKGWHGELIAYANSGDTCGDKSQVVGYGCYAFFEGDAAKRELAAEEKRYLLNLARRTIANCLETGKSGDIEEPPFAALCEPAATFVSLHKDGDLRGCVGTLEARHPLYLSVAMNALSAAFEDDRFEPLKKEELGSLAIEVSVLGKLEPLRFTSAHDLLKKLIPGEHGVVIEHGGCSATFLPQVWEQIPDKAQFMSELCAKAGLPPNAWLTRDLRVWTYRASVFGEEKKSSE